MKRIAEIIDGKVWRVFDVPDAKEPPRGNNQLRFVDVTGMKPEPEEGDLYDGETFTKLSVDDLKEKLMTTRDAMLAQHAHLFETALCHYMHGGITPDDRGYLNWREKMRTLKQNPAFDPKNPTWPDLKDEIIAERNRT